jgi:hypothetical protein
MRTTPAHSFNHGLFRSIWATCARQTSVKRPLDKPHWAPVSLSIENFCLLFGVVRCRTGHVDADDDGEQGVRERLEGDHDGNAEFALQSPAGYGCRRYGEHESSTVLHAAWRISLRRRPAPCTYY